MICERAIKEEHGRVFFSSAWRLLYIVQTPMKLIKHEKIFWAKENYNKRTVA